MFISIKSLAKGVFFCKQNSRSKVKNFVKTFKPADCGEIENVKMTYIMHSFSQNAQKYQKLNNLFEIKFYKTVDKSGEVW